MLGSVQIPDADKNTSLARQRRKMCCKINLITLGVSSCTEVFDCSLFSWCRHGNGPQAACTIVLGGELLFIHDCRWCFGV